MEYIDKMQKENEKHLELQFIHQEAAFKKATDYHLEIISKKDRIITNLQQSLSYKTKMIKELNDNYKAVKSELMSKSVELCNVQDTFTNFKITSTKNSEELELIHNTIIAEYKANIDTADHKIAELQSQLNKNDVSDFANVSWEKKNDEVMKLKRLLNVKNEKVDDLKAINVGLCEDFEKKEKSYKEKVKLLKRKVKQLKLALHNYADEEFEEDEQEADGTPSEVSDMEDIEMMEVEDLLVSDSAVSDTDSDFDLDEDDE